MNSQTQRQTFWQALPLIGFFVSEWQTWQTEKTRSCYRLTSMPQRPSELPLYPLDMPHLLALPFGSLDEAGVPYNAATTKYPAAYQPTTIAQYALANWNAYLTTGDEKYKQAFMIQADWLVGHESHLARDAGGWPIPFPMQDYYASAPWLSALTQGNGISVLVRAYQLTGEDIFLQVARRAVRSFELDIRDGGVSTCLGSDGVFFEEVAVYPAAHILNGCLLGLFGLYDYIALTDDAQIATLIRRSHDTLHTLLDSFDTGYWSRYDLRSKNPTTPFYHALHVALFNALALYSGCQQCSALASRWEAYKYRPSYFIALRLACYRRGLQQKLSRLSILAANRTQMNVSS